MGGFIVTNDYIIGAVLLGAGIVLSVLALPHKDGQAARWLRWEAAPVVFPGVLIVIYALGVAELATGYLTK
jgi:hypothetical protein